MREALIKGLTTGCILGSFVIWLPTWLKIIHLHSSHEYSLFSFALILALQGAQLTVAYLTKSRAFVWYYLVNTTIVAATCGLIYVFGR